MAWWIHGGSPAGRFKDKRAVKPVIVAESSGRLECGDRWRTTIWPCADPLYVGWHPRLIGGVETTGHVHSLIPPDPPCFWSKMILCADRAEGEKAGTDGRRWIWWLNDILIASRCQKNYEARGRIYIIITRGIKTVLYYSGYSFKNFGRGVWEI
jgi:hypothetical protein